MPLFDNILGWLGERSLRMKARRAAKSQPIDETTAAQVLEFFHRFPEKHEFFHEGESGVALFHRSDVTRIRQHAPGIGERVMAAMVGPGVNYGTPSSWTNWRGEMVQHYRHFVYEAINAICENVSCLTPNIGFVRHRDVPLPHHRQVWGQRRYLKTLHTIKPHEEIEHATPDHPLVKLFRNPNRVDTAYDLWYELIMFLKLTGNSYLWCVPNVIGRPVELWVIPSHWVWPVSDGTGRLVDRYKIIPWPGRMMMEIPAEEVIHFKFKSPMHKVDGWSPLMAGSEVIDTYESVQRSRFWSFKNGCFATGVLTLDATYNNPNDQSLERIYQKFFARFQGEWNYGKPIIVPAGTKYDQLKISPNEMDYVQSAEQLQNWVLSLFKVPKEIVGLQPSGSDLSWYAPMHQFCNHVLKPLLLYAGQVLTEKLASRWDRELRVWWDDPTPDNPAQVNEDLRLDAQYGTITDNEWRAARGREAWPNEAADMPWKTQGRYPLPLNRPGNVKELENSLINWKKPEQEQQQNVTGETPANGQSGKGDPLAGKTPASPEQPAQTRAMKSADLATNQHFAADMQLKAAGTCKPGQTAEETGCTPASGEIVSTGAAPAAANNPEEKKPDSDEPEGWDGTIDQNEVKKDRGRGESISTWTFYSDDGETYEHRISLVHGEYDTGSETVDVWRWEAEQNGQVTERGDWTTDESQAAREGEEYSSDLEAESRGENRRVADDDDDEESEEVSSAKEVLDKFDDNDLLRINGFDNGELNKGAVKKWEGEYSDDKPLEAWGMEISVNHPDLKSYKAFVGVDADGRTVLRLNLIEVQWNAPKGVGAKIFSEMVRNATASGVDYIMLHAAGNPGDRMNGYYTWPRFGFDESLETIEEDSPELAESIRERFPDAESILDVMSSPEGRDWWKENGSDLYQMKFDLSNGSRNREIFDAYMQAKKKV